MNGLTMHLYSLRSKRNWGIGDFTDLLNLMKYAAEKKLDFVGINPLHALFTSKPAFASPYSPSSREWLNPIYLDIEKVGAFTYNEQLKNWLAQPKIRQRIAALRVTETVTYTAAWACKRDALHMAFNAFEQDTCEAAANERAAFEAFVLEKGKALQGFGLFEALDQYYSRPGQVGWQSWPSEFHQPDGEAVEKFARSHEREIRFYMWLQWLCAEQLQEVNQAAAEYGVKLGTLPDAAAFQTALDEREHDKADLLDKLKYTGCLGADVQMPAKADETLLAALHKYGALSRSKLYAVQLENLLGVIDNLNVPGVPDGYPNWAQKMPVSLEDFLQHRLMGGQLAIIDEVRMKTNSQIKAYHELDQIERDTVESLFLATHSDLFAYLGRHRLAEGDEVVRVLIPGAVSVDIVNRRSGELIVPSEKIDERGFFVAVLPDDAPDYALSIRYTEDSEPVIEEDPYHFSSALQDMDSWLLAEGKHLRPYETLGAHFAELDGVKGVRFAVWAPNAQRVSVIGEFNNWDGRRHVMRFHCDNGIWDIFIPAVKLNALYKFEIRDANGDVQQKTDPYAFGAELRPNTASVVRGLPEKVDAPDFRARANAIDAPISIYEVHLGSWKRNPENNFWLTYEQLAKELVAYVKDMGFTHIEFLPVSEYPFDGSWGYQATGLYAPTSRFGSPDELRALIKAAHDEGIGVILDWVVGHFPTDDHGLAKFDGTALYEHADPREGYHQDWNTLIYNFGRNEVKNFLQGNALYWIERFGFDGIRVDAVASMIYRNYSRKEGEWIPNQYGGHENLEAIAFLRDTNTMLKEVVPSATEIAEESTSFANVTRQEGLNFSYKWNMGWMNDTLRYMMEDPINRKYHHNKMTFGMMYQYSENFVLPLSHDEVVHGKRSLLGRMPGDCWQQFANLRAYYGFMYGFPGKKLLFMGNEFAQGREWNYNEGLDWFLLDQEGGWHKGVQNFVRDLNRVYKDTAPLYQLDQWPEGFEWLVADDGNNSVFIFERRDREGNRVIVISNFTPVVHDSYRFGVNEAGEYREILNSDDPDYNGSGVSAGQILQTEEIWSHGRPNSLAVKVPPLATVYLYKAAQPSATDSADQAEGEA